MSFRAGGNSVDLKSGRVALQYRGFEHILLDSRLRGNDVANELFGLT
jgi:hypothetical protein